MDLGHRGERDLDRPGKTQDHVFEDGAVVISLNTDEMGSWIIYVCMYTCVCVCVLTLYLVWIHNLFSEEGVLSSARVKQSPVHAQVPDEGVQGADRGEYDQQVEKHIGVCMSLFCINTQVTKGNIVESSWFKVQFGKN